VLCNPKEGLLAIAEGGTVFLDEVGELPVDLQAKMLRALQEKEIRPVGSAKLVPINVRILGQPIAIWNTRLLMVLSGETSISG
jgi:transcriptional regulator with PAS, ATPase and Fis domain